MDDAVAARRRSRMMRRKAALEGERLSFSAQLPEGLRGAYAEGSICAVVCSRDPLADFRASVAEMVAEVGVRDWGEMEELIYCYLALNPSSVHGIIADAFLSVCCSPLLPSSLVDSSASLSSSSSSSSD